MPALCIKKVMNGFQIIDSKESPAQIYVFTDYDSLFQHLKNHFGLLSQPLEHPPMKDK